VKYLLMLEELMELMELMVKGKMVDFNALLPEL
jgi:hypothetical protein